MAAVVGAVTVVVAAAAFAAAGPLQPGWSARSGTSPALLAQLATSRQATGSSSAGSTGTVPAAPFTAGLTGAQSQTGPDGNGQVQVTLTMQLDDTARTPLDVTLTGPAASGGGVTLSSGSVTFGSYQGTVTALQGGTVDATVDAPTPVDLVLSLTLDQATGSLSGSVSGTAAGSSR